MVKRAAICVILGVLTTVAIAWSCAIAVDVDHGELTESTLTGSGETWAIWLFQYAGVTRVQRTPQRDLVDSGVAKQRHIMMKSGEDSLPRWSAARTPPTPQQMLFKGTIVEQACGWPWRSLISESRFAAVGPSAPSVPSALRYESTALPLQPIWLGFLGDTAVYAAAWSLLVILPQRLRALARRRRGSCIECGYDLRYTVEPPRMCPECGRASAE